MAFFEVTGWSMPIAPTANPIKRKRPGAEEADMIRSAQVNIEKLMKKLKHESLDEKKKSRGKDIVKDVAVGSTSSSHGKRKRKETSTAPYLPSELKEPSAVKKHKKIKGKEGGRISAAGNPGNASPPPNSAERLDEQLINEPPRRRSGKSGQNTESKVALTPDQKSSVGPSNAVSLPSARTSNLTALQTNMKQSLDGARFRWINEVLYKSDSSEAHRMVKENPGVFEEYHTGFRHQVTSWPSNPVTHFISTISSYPKGSVIVDLGCGDAALAQAIIQKGLNVLSYDLISPNGFVVEADICAKLPLPGHDGASSTGQIVDVVVCSLSLMSTNWLMCIREAHRVLKPSGELKIAEVASRFKDVNEFTSAVCAVGFKLHSQDERNSHFSLFDLRKVERAPLTEKEWKKIASRGDVLQPCEYKRR